MCGFAGFLGSTADAATLVRRMVDTLSHRGPDDSGVWVNPDEGIALGHRRLSILDLSVAGHQPMHSAGDRFAIAFNGEIYNHEAVRSELEAAGAAPPWRGHSDTEVLLAACVRWGVEAALKKLVGMFAFALWDRETKTLTLARDRLGEKPLYYGMQGGVCLFGSELKALKLHPAFRGELDRDALALLLRHGYIPAPHSIYRGIYKLPAGTYLTIQAGSPPGRPMAYWSARAAAEAGCREPFSGSTDEACTELQRMLARSVAGQSIADVPVGAFLSGGIDSSMVVALMQELSSRPVRTFTIGFAEQGYDEAKSAQAVAEHLGTQHTQLYVTPEHAMAVIPTLPEKYDEPFADSSQVPAFLVSQLARQQVTVSLSGDGGDELFGGYNRYFWGDRVWKGVGWVSPQFRQGISRMLTALPAEQWDRIFSGVTPFLPSRLQVRNPGDKLHKLARVMPSASPEHLYLALVSLWGSAEAAVLGAREAATDLTDRTKWADVPGFVERMMYLDLVTYLPDDILAKVDRAAMSVGLETRVPFLDHRLVEFAWSLPLAMKIQNGKGKQILRKLLYKYVPEKLIERPKMGFGIPLDAWLRGPLRDWAESLLDERSLKREGIFDAARIRRKWKEHLSGTRNWQHHLWCVLMFQAWLAVNSSTTQTAIA